jgi:hypothetical protein
VRSTTFIAVAAGLLVLFGAVGGIYAYDHSRQETIAEGVRIGGVDVGGLDRAAATRRLQEALVDPLLADVVVKTRGQTHTLTADVAKVSLDTHASVDEALLRSRDGNAISRTWRGLTGGEVDADIRPGVRYSKAAVKRFVARVARNAERDARDAKVDFTPSGVTVVRSRRGIELNRAALTRSVVAALQSPDDRTPKASYRVERPKVTTAKLAKRYGTLLTVDRAHFTLRIFKNLKLAKSYRIALGQVGLETPAGLYRVQNKAVNPAWNVPNSAWAGDLAGTVVPGGTPQNPLKARWLGIYDGVGIHGTDARYSIGTNASHGCIRMLVEDVIDLYDRVPVGTPVYIA